MPQSIYILSHVTKRDGSRKSFDATKIQVALARAGLVSGEFGAQEAVRLTEQAVLPAIRRLGLEMPHIEQIQDTVEAALFDAAYRKTLRAYIVYREQHKKLRAF